jgi:DNA ligase-1
MEAEQTLQALRHQPLFSRRVEDVSAQFPEIVEAIPSSLQKGPAIVEGECVPVDPVTGELRPFQEISRRRGRKYELTRFQEEVPVRLVLFDVLLAPEGPTLDRPYPDRRSRLEALVRVTDRIDLAAREVVRDLGSAEAFFLRALSDGCEGVMVKSLAPGSRYRAGARGFWWIKYKREYTHELADTVDTVVVGAFRGRGRRAGRYGALLVAVYDSDREVFPTLCKVGTGFDDQALEDLTRRLSPHELKEPPKDVVSTLVPDVWLEPSLVLELRGAELTLSPVHRAGDGLLRAGYGFALRFPRFTGRIREDKSPEEATEVKELLRLYQTQVRHAEAETPEGLPEGRKAPRKEKGTPPDGTESP